MKKNTILLICISALLIVFIMISSFISLFPLKFKNEIVIFSSEFELSPVLVASVIWAESGFDEKAISSAGAVGLMQLKPSTAEYVHISILKQSGDFSLENSTDNIRLGCAYLKHLIGKFSVLETALAAYNAGEGNVRIWLLDSDYSDDGISLKHIPFKETRDYVKKINFAWKIYKHFFN